MFAELAGRSVIGPFVNGFLTEAVELANFQDVGFGRGGGKHATQSPTLPCFPLGRAGLLL